jgi:hypothetical protein
MKRVVLVSCLVAAAATSAVRAQGAEGTVFVPPVFISEVLNNPPSNDNGFEGIELSGPPGQSLAGYKFLVVEGESLSIGLVDVVLDLGAFSFGSNGLFLWRDAATAINSGVPAVYLTGPNGATTINVADFNPDLENGTQTYILGFGTAPAVASDIDTNNDGVIDAGFGAFTVVDAVGYLDGGAGEIAYGAALGFVNVGTGSGALSSNR